MLTRALRDLDAAGIEVRDVMLRRPTLDDAFLTLTGHHAVVDGVVQARAPDFLAVFLPHLAFSLEE